MIIKQTKVTSINSDNNMSVNVRVSMKIMEDESVLSELPPHRAVFKNTQNLDAEIEELSKGIVNSLKFPPISEEDMSSIKAIVKTLPESVNA